MEQEGAAVFLERSRRATRGKRLTKLLDDETEADEEFWGQDAFREIAEDVEYEAEEDVVDEFDSDFDEDEANVEEEAPEDEVERVKKKRLLPPGTKPIRKDKKKAATQKTKGLDVIEAAVAAAMQSKADEPTPIQAPSKLIQEGTEFIEGFLDFEGEKTVRKSTRTAVVVRQAEREALRAAMQATAIKPVKKKREGERRITQEDMLLEAAQTEILNRQQLERMLAREEEVKQKAIVHKAVYSGPQIRFYSRDGKNFLEFMGAVAESQKLFGQLKQSYKRPQLCAVTGLPAKYVDPLTGLPYATKEAFKTIRERVDEDDYTQRERTPGKKLRSARTSFGRPTVRKARSILSTPSHGKLNSSEGRAVSYKASTREEAQQLHSPEDSPMQESIIDLTSRPLFHGMSPQQPTETRSATHTLSDCAQALDSVKNQSASSSLKNLSEPRWVEIPPPKEGPSEDVYFLDDLTSLNFGPILASEHGLNSQSQREDELDIDDPTSVGTLLPLDVLPMPREFGANVII
eukprot:c15507_g1_i1 orf=127-1680(+)